MTNGKWSFHNFITKFKHETFYALIRFIGPWAAYPLLYAVVFAYSLRPKILRRSAPYLNRRFPGEPLWKRWRHSFRLNLSFGLVLLERAIMGLTKRMEFSSPPQSLKTFSDLLAEGRGLVILSAHVGSWQTAMGWMTQMGDARVNIVQLRQETDVDRHYFEHDLEPGEEPSQSVKSPRVIDVKDPASALLLMTSALLSGEIVCLMGDRTQPGDPLTITTPFLGGNIQLPGLPFYLAAKVGAPLVVVLTRRAGKSKVFGEVCQVIRPQVGGTISRTAETSLPMAQQFVACLEKYTDTNPYQFFNFYDLWQIDSDKRPTKG